MFGPLDVSAFTVGGFTAAGFCKELAVAENGWMVACGREETGPLSVYIKFHSRPLLSNFVRFDDWPSEQLQRD